MPKVLLPKARGQTPVDNGCKREEEIATWLRRHGPGRLSDSRPGGEEAAHSGVEEGASREVPKGVRRAEPFSGKQLPCSTCPRNSRFYPGRGALGGNRRHAPRLGPGALRADGWKHRPHRDAGCRYHSDAHQLSLTISHVSNFRSVWTLSFIFCNFQNFSYRIDLVAERSWAVRRESAWWSVPLRRLYRAVAVTGTVPCPTGIDVV